jgi:hypothetical protein
MQRKKRRNTQADQFEFGRILHMALSRRDPGLRVVTAYVGWCTGPFVVILATSFIASIAKVFNLNTSQTGILAVIIMAAAGAGALYLVRRYQGREGRLRGIVLAFILAASALSILLALLLTNRPSAGDCVLKANVIVCP